MIVGLDFVYNPKRLCSSVAKSAKLLGIKGSEQQRKNLAAEFRSNFFQKINDKFEMQKGVAPQDVQTFFNELAPNVEVDVVDFVKSSGSSTAAYFAYKKAFNGTAVTGYRFSIPFPKSGVIRKEDKFNLCCLSHELSHFSRSITEPKYAAKMLRQKLPIGADYSQINFYDKFLYKDERGFLNRFLGLDKKTKRIDSVKNKIDKFFKSERFNSEEKVDVLQKWRYRLLDEFYAYRDEYSFEGAVVDVNKSEAGSCCFPEKIKLIETMLAQEIAKVRDGQKKLFGKS